MGACAARAGGCGNFAFGWFTDGLPVRRPAFCSLSRLALGLDLLSRFAFCLCGSLHLRDPGSFSLCLLGRFALDLAGGFTLRLLRRLALRAFGSLDLRFLSGFALCLPRRLALGFSRSVALRLLGSFTLRSLDCLEPRLLCCLALRLLRSFAPGFLRGGKPCSLGRGFATRGLSPGLFSKRVELCGPVVCLLDRSRTVGGIELCLLCSGLELRHLLPCRTFVRSSLLRGAFCLRSGPSGLSADLRLRSCAPGFLRGGKPCSLGRGFATRGLSPGLFSKRVELCGPVVCLLDRSRTLGGIELCLLCSGLELRHLLPCRICVRTTLLLGAFCLRCGAFALGCEVVFFLCSCLQPLNSYSNLPPLGRRCSPALLGLLDIQFGFRFRLRLRFFWHGGPRSKLIEYICPKTCVARTDPAMRRRKD